MDLAFVNNQEFQLPLNVVAWSNVLPLTLCTLRMQIRTDAAVPQVIYSWSSDPSDKWGNGTITYTPETAILYIYAPYDDMKKLPPGSYVWDLQLTYGTYVKLLTQGAVVISSGVTR